jgi:hypothetical protein
MYDYLPGQVIQALAMMDSSDLMLELDWVEFVPGLAVKLRMP